MTVEWDALFHEATDYLQQLLRIDTTNPPGNEIEAIRFLEAILRREGCAPIILEAAPTRANLVCRLTSNGHKGPLLLTSHVDVVPADAAQWRYPPFNGTVADGYIWGRGALDMKSKTILDLMAVLIAKRQRLPLRRDLIFVAVADEEYETKYGSAYLVTHHPDLIRAEYALNEGGGYTLHIGGQRLYPIQVAEKGLVWLKLTARGRPGHGSAPHAEVATTRIGYALHRLRHQRLGFHSTAVVRDFFRALACCGPFHHRLALRGLCTTGLDRCLAPWLPEGRNTPFLRAMLYNTACPTACHAGQPTSINVIPSEASCWIDGRILPGQSPADFLRELTATLGNTFEYDVVRSRHATLQPYPTPLYDALCTGITQADPGAHTAPVMLTGMTDAHFYKKIGIITYGFQPIQFPPDVHPGEQPHAHDERIPLAGFHWGVKTFSEVVSRFVTS